MSHGKSMENCANMCLDSNCVAYEYCQGREPKSGEFSMTCRISSNIDSKEKSLKHSQDEDCSVYIIKELKAHEKAKAPDFLSLALKLGFFFFTVSFIFGAGIVYLWKSQENGLRSPYSEQDEKTATEMMKSSTYEEFSPQVNRII